MPRPVVSPSAAARVEMAPESSSSKTGWMVALAVLLLGGGAYAMFGMGPDTGGLVVSVAGPGGTAVSGVSVLVDGEEKCAKSTCKITDLKAGSYVVQAIANGYKEMAGKAYEVQPGEQKAINIELVAKAGSAGLKVSSKASGLILTIDGKKIGPLPQELPDLPPGTHKVELSGDFIKPFEKTIEIKEGEGLQLEPDLELATGNVIVKLGEDANGARVSLTVDGKRKSLKSLLKNGETGPIKIPNDGKKYTITATKKNFEKFEEELNLTVEKPVQTVTVDLVEQDEEGGASSATATPSRNTTPTRTTSPRTSSPAPKPAASGAGKININSIPVSSIILDGRPLGSTPKIGVSVKSGSHTIVFVHPKHGRKVRSVKVKPGGTTTAAVRFP